MKSFRSMNEPVRPARLPARPTADERRCVDDTSVFTSGRKPIVMDTPAPAHDMNTENIFDGRRTVYGGFEFLVDRA